MLLIRKQLINLIHSLEILNKAHWYRASAITSDTVFKNDTVKQRYFNTPLVVCLQ